MDNILFICTGNICRSPMAEGLLRSNLEAHSAEFSIASAGIEDLSGRAAHKHALNVMRKMNVDISGHRSRYATTGILRSSDLIIGMTRGHVRSIVERDAGLFPKTFTIGEFLRRATGIPMGEIDDLPSWIERVHGNRDMSDLVGQFDLEDIADPLGSARRQYRRTALRLKELTSELSAILMSERA